jgi:hypothetical protein
MAGTLLHVTLAEKALWAADLSPGMRSTILEYSDDYHLGAVLVDLPYYERLWLTAWRLARKEELTFGKWGEILHSQAPAHLALGLLDRAGSDPGRALAMGALTHHAVDLVFHPEINRLMHRLNADPKSNAVHKALEDQLDLHSHLDLLGHPGIGTPYARRMLTIRPGRKWFIEVHTLLLEVLGQAPSPAKLVGWAGNLALFGWLNSWSGAPWVTTTGPDDAEMKERALELAAQAIRRAATHLETGARYLAGEIDRPQFLTQVPQLSLLDGMQVCPPPGRGLDRGDPSA